MLVGKVALVTGGSTGIGRSASLELARQGATVVVSDINAQEAEATVKSIREHGGEGVFMPSNVAKASEVEALVASIVERYGRLDCAFNNAGIGGPMGVPIHELVEADWEQVANINLKGVWLCMKYEIAQMLKQGAGAIVNTASIWGLVGAAGAGAYVASKHGVAGLTKAAALEYAAKGIRINAVCPGTIRTPILDPLIEANPDVIAQLAALHPIGRIGEPSEVAAAVAWLFSDAASFVVGQNLPVDGGYTVQ